MKKTILVTAASLSTALLPLFGSAAWAQKPANRPRAASTRSFAYDIRLETVVQGTVLSYTAEASAPPIGAHVLLQTSSGTINLLLGAASFLQANHFALAKGDTVRVVGMNSSTRQGAVFLVRVIEKGGQSLTLRTTRGAPLSRAGGRAMSPHNGQQQATKPEGAQ